MVRRFHISSCGRSGSKYLTEAIKNMGISVIHEMGDDWPIPSNQGVTFFAMNRKQFANYRGIVGWKWSLLTPQYAASFPIQMHMVRHPLKAISSATTHSPGLFKMIEDKIGAPDFVRDDHSEEDCWLARAVNYWIRFNAQFGADKPILRIEEFTSTGQASKLFCDMTGAVHEARVLLDTIPKDVNARPKASRRINVTWEKLDATFPDQAGELRRMAQGFGYTA